ncbi:Metallo-hydrolase/oxidoreductase [Martensiomyces pterosporus]|nr:Metallo-hydrolase/oxidoreductase [Martensiomyces pterosporus]
MAAKRKADLVVPIEDESDLLQITPLGAGQEVGRSCIVLRYKGKTVMLDCGLHPAYDGENSLPFIDEVDPATVDVLLVTHFHVDHAAAVPFYIEKTAFKGRTFMTHPTKAIFRWLVSDYVRVTNNSSTGSSALYDEQDMMRAFAKIEAIDFHQQIEVDGIKFTAYNAGHVLGAAMYVIEIAGVKVLYTGDYSREEDRHLMAAENPGVSVDVLITESTYGVQSHEPRLEREARFTSTVRDIVRRGGRCLMPVFALGRTQELLLILEEYWQRHGAELESVPVYFASSLANRCMTFYESYILMMNQRIQRQFRQTGRNPFQFQHISNLRNLSSFDDAGPCVMVASPGMLQSGLSRELFDRWAPDRRNGLVITGYSVEGTLARTIMNEPNEVMTLSGQRIPRRMSVNYISFSAHVDYTQNSEFIDEIRAPHLVLVHGEQNAMMRLRSAISDKYQGSDYNVKIHAPKNIETVELHFRGEKMARVIGGLASKVPQEGDRASGILVQRDFKYTLVDAADLREFNDIAPVVIEQQQIIPYHSSFALLKYHLEQMFGQLQQTTVKSGSGETNVLRVYDVVEISHSSSAAHVEVEWEGNAMNDMVADSVVAVVLNIECSPASVKLTRSSCTHSHGTTKCKGGGHNGEAALVMFMKQQFTQVETPDDRKEVVVHLNDARATVDMQTLNIQTDSPILRSRIAAIIARVRRTMRSLSHRSVALPEQLPHAEQQQEQPEEVSVSDAAASTCKAGDDKIPTKDDGATKADPGESAVEAAKADGDGHRSLGAASPAADARAETLE